MTAAIRMAPLRESAPDPTEVANAFATSFAPRDHAISKTIPIPKAQKKATTAQHQGIQTYSLSSTIQNI